MRNSETGRGRRRSGKFNRTCFFRSSACPSLSRWIASSAARWRYLIARSSSKLNSVTPWGEKDNLPIKNLEAAGNSLTKAVKFIKYHWIKLLQFLKTLSQAMSGLRKFRWYTKLMTKSRSYWHKQRTTRLLKLSDTGNLPEKPNLKKRTLKKSGKMEPGRLDACSTSAWSSGSAARTRRRRRGRALRPASASTNLWSSWEASSSTSAGARARRRRESWRRLSNWAKQDRNH